MNIGRHCFMTTPWSPPPGIQPNPADYLISLPAGDYQPTAAHGPPARIPYAIRPAPSRLGLICYLVA